MSTPNDPLMPPRVAAWLVSRVLPAAARDVVLGDLQERFAARARRDGAVSARRWYRRQARAFVLRLPAARAVALVSGRTMRDARSGDARPGSGGGIASGIAADARLAARTLRRRPGLTLNATVILALAVGANVTVFSVIDGVLVERLPFPDPDRLVMLWDVYPPESGMGEHAPITLAHYRAWADRSDLFSAVGAFESTTPALVEGDWPERVDAATVTANLLQLLGARAALGRLFVADDGAPGAEPVVVLSHGLWASRFGADRGIVGRSILLDGVRTRVVGVTSREFWFYDPYSVTRSLTGRNAEAARLWQPLPEEGGFGGETDYPRYRVIARVRDGLSVAAAEAAARALRSRLPPTSAGDGAQVELLPLADQIVAEARPRLMGLLGAVSLVLLIACVNLVSLLVVHLDSRRPELALRAALGAGRSRLMRQLVVESTLLALTGGVVGLLLSVPATRWLLELVPRGLPLAHRVGLDAGVASFGLGLAVLCGAATGVTAAWRVDAGRLAGAIAASSRSVAGSRASRRVHGMLLTFEVALSLVLLIAATLLLRSLAGLHATDTGFRAQDVLTFEAGIAPRATGESNPRYFAELEASVLELPGVTGVGSTSALPFSRWVQRARIEVDQGTPAAEPPRIDHRLVSPGYFEAIGLPLRSGRHFGPGDREGAPPVVIVNEAFVDRWLAGDPEPLGRTVIVTRRDRVVHTIIGVVANVKHHELFEADRPIVYAPVAQSPIPWRRFAVRAAGGDLLALVEPIRRRAAEIDPTQPLQGFITMEALVAQSMEEETFYTQLVAAFAATAVLLTLIGIYGVVSFTTRQRDREVGIRMALGARAGSVRRLVMGQGLVPVWIGLGLGWLGGFASTGLLQSLLHGVPGHDPVSYGLATASFALVAAAACLVPARRAARLDPVQVLRGE